MLTFFEVVLGVIIGNILSGLLLKLVKLQKIDRTKVKTNYDPRYLKVDYIVNEKGEYLFHVFDESNDMFLFSATTYREIEQFCINIFFEKGIIYILPQKELIKILQISKEPLYE